MMEFYLRVLVDSQDPEIAYNELRQSLQYTRLEIRIQDKWLRNNEPLPANTAQICAARWLTSKDPLTVDHKVRFQTDDPAVQAHLDTMHDTWETEGTIGFVKLEKEAF